MSDPLSMAAGVVGLTQAAFQIVKTLTKIAVSAKNAPEQIAIALKEVTETSTILLQLQDFLFCLERANEDGASRVQIDHVVVILSGCIATYSDLEAFLDGIDLENLTVLDRLMWTKSERKVTDIVGRLQTHKASLSLLLIILNGLVVPRSRRKTYANTDETQRVDGRDQELR